MKTVFVLACLLVSASAYAPMATRAVGKKPAKKAAPKKAAASDAYVPVSVSAGRKPKFVGEFLTFLNCNILGCCPPNLERLPYLA